MVAFLFKTACVFYCEIYGSCQGDQGGELDQAYGMNFVPGLSVVYTRGWETTGEQRDWETTHEHSGAIADIYP